MPNVSHCKLQALASGFHSVDFDTIDQSWTAEAAMLTVWQGVERSV